MVSHSLPSPPAEDNKSSTSTLSRKGTGSSTKSVKPTHRTSKRAGSNAAAVHHHEQVTHSGMDGRHKRVWKACERCRMKKTKVSRIHLSRVSNANWSVRRRVPV